MSDEYCACRIDSALEGMWCLLQSGQVESNAVELVVSGLTKTGRLRDAAELLEEAAVRSAGRPILTLDKTNAILSSLSMSCSAEDDYARGFVEVNARFQCSVYSDCS